MKMEKQLTRKEYIESELGKWKEVYEINFQDEFDLKAMLDLQYQYMITPTEHIKTIGDIIHTKNQIMKNLNLKQKRNVSMTNEKMDFLIIVKNDVQMIDLETLLLESVDKKIIEKKYKSSGSTEIVTDKYRIKIKKYNENLLRGTRADIALKVDNAKEYIRGKR
jgi:hypothetical protein